MQIARDWVTNRCENELSSGSVPLSLTTANALTAGSCGRKPRGSCFITRWSSLKPLASSRFAERGWQEYRTGISYFSAMALIAVNRLLKFFSVSDILFTIAYSSIYFPFSNPSRSCISEASISFRLFRSTSAIGDPVTRYALGQSRLHEVTPRVFRIGQIHVE